MNEHVDELSTEATNTVASTPEVITEEAEEWRPIAGYVTLYEVSSHGRIRSNRRVRGGSAIMKTQVLHGKTTVLLYKSPKRIRFDVDFLVATAFYKKPEGVCVVRHKDGNPINDKVSNLEWYRDPALNDIEWRPVVGFEDLYSVSNTGLIRSNKRGRLLTPKLDKYGYLHLGLRTGKGPKRVWFTIHKLVAMAFIPNPENKATIDHINGNKLDNRVENLRWATSSENIHNPVTFAFLKSKEFSDLKKQQQAHLNKPVICMTDNNAYYPSIHEAVRITGMHKANITDSCKHYAAGKTQVKYRNGKEVKHWRWATPEEIEAHKNDTESPS